MRTKRKRNSRPKRKRLQKEWKERKVEEVEENMDAVVSLNFVQLVFFFILATIHLSPKFMIVCDQLHYIRM